MSGGILVLVEHTKGAIADITFEMLGAARMIGGSLGRPVEAVLMGGGVSALTEQLGAADRVVVVDDPALEPPPAEAVLAVLLSLVSRSNGALVLAGGTNATFGLAARLSMRAGLKFLNFCRGIRVEDGAAVFTSQLFGGKILCDVRLPGNQGVVSVCPGSFSAAAGRTSRVPEVEKMAAPAAARSAAFKRFIEPAGGDIDITQQDVLVSVGRGIQSADNIALAEELAQALGGAVSASRPVVDQGWVPLTRQVGKSGMTVRPKLYLALGISGAPEHQEGMRDSSLIIAVNTDPAAPIFDIARYGASVDCLDLLEPLKAAVEKRKAALRH